MSSGIFFVALLLSTLCLTGAAPDGSEADPDAVDTSTCSLYLAPSSIPDAGLGIYTGVDVKAGSMVGELDELFVPVVDKFKTLPYRGQQKFLSWLGYVWPEEIDTFYTSPLAAFPWIPNSFYCLDEGLNGATGVTFVDSSGNNVSAFSPGIASLANSERERFNIQQKDGATFTASQDILAGSELLLDYGWEWHRRYNEKNTYPRKEKATLEEYKEHDYEENFFAHAEEVEAPAQAPPIQKMHWLEKNGVCLDNIQAGPSTIVVGEKGAFAKKYISKGSIIAPAPLLVLKRDDLVIYEADESKQKFREVLDLNKVTGQERLLNYAYGHVDSQLLLVPYSPAVNYINHNGQAPNAEIRWPKTSSPVTHDPKQWLEQHPLDVLDQSGKLLMEFVALRDIQPGEEIFINYGPEWEQAWRHNDDKTLFRQEIGVPSGFFPDAWKNQSVVYEVAPPESSPLKPGELELLRWAHNGKIIAKNAYRVGLPRGFSAHLLEYSKERGLIERYKTLLYSNELESNEWRVFDSPSGDEKWFAQRYMSNDWNFNMHYIAAWDEAARVSVLRDAFGKAGFDIVLESLGTEFGLDNLTCFHASWMGVSDCDNSFTHADIYATDDKGFNIIFPVIVVNGSKPELDIISDDANIVVSVNYEYDTAYVMGDWVYHKTSPNDYADSGQMRIVVGTYCAQIDDSNADMIAYLYEGEDPAPFHNQFDRPFKETHWGNGHSLLNLKTPHSDKFAADRVAPGTEHELLKHESLSKPFLEGEC